jgi:L-threonylcarbamoyladenylate synthase
MILDGGPCSVGIESTVLDLSGGVPTILRPGRVTAGEVEAVIGRVGMHGQSVPADRPAVSPGQQEIHYAPVTRAYRFETAQREMIPPETDGVANGIVVLSPLVIFKKWGPIIAMPRDAGLYARELYGVLRELDARGLGAIYIEMPPDTPEWAAVRDRLMRATRLPPGI